jgi:hypothetical protein
MKSILGVILYIFSNISLACSCSMGEVPEKFKESDNVFTGQIETIKFLKRDNEFGDPRIIVTFKIEQYFKGNSSKTTLHTAYNEMGCTGYWFKEKQSYLIYAFKEKRKLNTMWCGGVIPKDSETETYSTEVKAIQDIIR